MVSSAGRPHGMLATHSISSPHRAACGRRTGGSASAPPGRPRTSACTPVISSSCDSLKSVVMCGCVSAEPSAAGCGVSASAPPGSARRLSFSMPRRMPRSRSGVNLAMRSSMRFKSCPLCRAGGRLAWSPRCSWVARARRVAGLPHRSGARVFLLTRHPGLSAAAAVRRSADLCFSVCRWRGAPAAPKPSVLHRAMHWRPAPANGCRAPPTDRSR